MGRHSVKKQAPHCAFVGKNGATIERALSAVHHQKIPFMTSNERPTNFELPTDQTLVLKVVPMPGDCNHYGDIFGGWVMAQVDLAGSVLAARSIRGRLATVAVNEFVFKHPVRVGDILSFFSQIRRVGRTSITVTVEVFSEQYMRQGKYTKVTEASLTYVALDDNGRPRAIQPPETPVAT